MPDFIVFFNSLTLQLIRSFLEKALLRKRNKTEWELIKFFVIFQNNLVCVI